MISLNNHSAGFADPLVSGEAPCAVCKPERFSVPFPGGECPVRCAGMNAHERAFASRYLRDIGLIVQSDPQKWENWREMLADESCPVLEFDPEWFSFLLPPKSLTRMELFAWYWLWIEPDHTLAVSRFAYCELSAAFDVACRPTEIWDELSNVVTSANEALLSGDDDTLEDLVSHDTAEGPRDRIDGTLIWFPRLIVDHEPCNFAGPVIAGEAETTVWGYLSSGKGAFDQVRGQIRARRLRGKWTLDPRPARTYQPAHATSDEEALRAFSE